MEDIRDRYKCMPQFTEEYFRIMSETSKEFTRRFNIPRSVGITANRRHGNLEVQKELLKAFNKPATIVVSDELYDTFKEFYEDCPSITIMRTEELFNEQQQILENYASGTGILLEPKPFNPRDSFEHIRKRNDKRIFRVR